MLVFSATYDVERGAGRRDVLFDPGGGCDRRGARGVRAPAGVLGGLRLVRHPVLLGPGGRPRGRAGGVARGGGGLPLPPRGDHGRRAARVAAVRAPRDRLRRTRLHDRGGDLRHPRAAPGPRRRHPVERLAQAVGLRRGGERPHQPGRHPGLPRPPGLVEARGERAGRDRRGAAAGRALRAPPRARAAAARGAARRGAGRAHPVAGRALQGPRLPVLPAAAHPELGARRGV